MVRLIYCVRRRSDLSREAFDERWREGHATLVREHADALRIRRYVQVPALEAPEVQERLRASRNARPLAFDGIAELRWESHEDLRTAQRTDEGREALEALYEDEKRFIDHEQSMLWYGTEREIIG